MVATVTACYFSVYRLISSDQEARGLVVIAEQGFTER
jgi:hypothetical protein